MRAFSFQWAQRTWTQRVDVYTGKPIPYSASNQFADAGIRGGDTIYVLGLGDDRTAVLAIGRFVAASRDELLDNGEIDAVLARDEASAVLGEEAYGVPLYEAEWFLVPRPGTASVMRFDREISPEGAFWFGRPGETAKPLFLDADGRVNQQALRSVRQLRPVTVRLLDEVIGT